MTYGNQSNMSWNEINDFQKQKAIEALTTPTQSYNQLLNQSGFGTMDELSGLKPSFSAKHPLASTLIGALAGAAFGGTQGEDLSDVFTGMALGTATGYGLSSKAKKSFLKDKNDLSMKLATAQMDAEAKKLANLSAVQDLLSKSYNFEGTVGAGNAIANINNPQKTGITIPEGMAINNETGTLIKNRLENYGSNKALLDMATQQEPSYNAGINSTYNSSGQEVNLPTIEAPMPEVSFSKGVQKWKPLIQKHADKYGVNPNLIAAMMQQESGGNEKAVSKAGAAGLMQLMPGTAKGLGVTNVYDPEQNIEASTKMMSRLLKKYNGNVSLALAAYNAGSGAVDKAGGIPNYPETKNYVKSIMSKISGTNGNLPDVNQFSTGGYKSGGYNPSINIPEEDLANISPSTMKDIVTTPFTQYKSGVEQGSKMLDRALSQMDKQYRLELNRQTFGLNQLKTNAYLETQGLQQQNIKETISKKQSEKQAKEDYARFVDLMENPKKGSEKFASKIRISIIENTGKDPLSIYIKNKSNKLSDTVKKDLAEYISGNNPETPGLKPINMNEANIIVRRMNKLLKMNNYPDSAIINLQESFYRQNNMRIKDSEGNIINPTATIQPVSGGGY